MQLSLNSGHLYITPGIEVGAKELIHTLHFNICACLKTLLAISVWKLLHTGSTLLWISRSLKRAYCKDRFRVWNMEKSFETKSGWW